MRDSLVRHGGVHIIILWIRATLEGRVVAASLNGSSMKIVVSRGCPQGDVLSPLLWCLVDDLIATLTGGGICIHVFEDDICLLAMGKFINTVSGLMQWALLTVDMCNHVGLSVNPDKTEL
jgi:hypothetical protein